MGALSGSGGFWYLLPEFEQLAAAYGIAVTGTNDQSPPS